MLQSTCGVPPLHGWNHGDGPLGLESSYLRWSDRLGWLQPLDRGMETAGCWDFCEGIAYPSRCLFRKYTASSPEFSLGAPRSSVASRAGLEPGVPRKTLAQDFRNGHLALRWEETGSQRRDRGDAQVRGQCCMRSHLEYHLPLSSQIQLERVGSR